MPSKIRNIITLLRIRQYYKNVLVFVAPFFSRVILDFSLYLTLAVGFIVLCAASSINYIINDIKDIESDKKHAEKLEKKPLASGEISVVFALLLIVVLSAIILISVLVIVPILNFIIMVILVLVTGQLYNHFLKNYAFIDILTLSTGYLWRALAGCFIINVYISPWLFLAIIEVALFLVIAKRKGDLLYLGEEEAKKHKKAYDKYSVKLLEQFHLIISASLFMTYSLYLMFRFNLFSDEIVFLYEYLIMLTIPLMLYIIMRFMYLTSGPKPEIARAPEKAFLDIGILIAGFLIFAILTFAFYYTPLVELLDLQ